MYVSQICLYVWMDVNNDYHHHLCVSIIIIIHLGTPTKLSPLYAGAVFPRSAKTITTTIPSINVDDDDNGSDDDDDDGGDYDDDDHDGAIMGMSIIDDYNNTGKSDENYVDRKMIVRNDDGIGIDDNNSRDRDQWVRTVGDGVVDNSTSITTTTSTSSSTSKSTLLSAINDELNYITLMKRYADAQNHR